ncbi:MAG: fused MFS/spermidine synthase [Candidatus Omnitrophica bacterium]|nr:fused MFS/spermidine synthase [Candidatus Omnitrophota bacterium]
MLETLALAIHRRSVRSFLLICFFASGACGLMYEVAWLRVLGLVFGNTTFATSTVLAGYMAGLGLGALFFGHLIEKTRKSPIFIYGMLEGGVALYAVITPFLWKIIEFIHTSFYQRYEPSFLVFSLFKFLISFGFLFFPTFLMGGTLPVISKFFIQQKKDIARSIGLLYALNTFGAVLGVFLCGFFLLYLLGVRETVFLTAGFNFFIFISCYAYAEKYSKLPALQAKTAVETKQAPKKDDTTTSYKTHYLPRGPISFLFLIMFAISGGISMVYEVAWTRVLAIVLGSSVYAFSVMLVTFLLGLALGSYLFSILSRKIKIDLSAFAILEMLAASFVFLGMGELDDMPYHFVRIFSLSGGSVWLLEFGKFLLCAIIMFPPTLCLGALFACFVHVYQHSESIGRELGVVYFSNTMGTILGSALTGFLIIPAIGIQTTLMIAAIVNAAIGVTAFLFWLRDFEWKRLMFTAGAFALVLASGFTVEAWDRSVLTSGTAIKPKLIEGMSYKDFLNTLREKQNLFYKEGTSATVSIDRVRDNISLSVNGKVDASVEDSFTQFFLGHLPMLLHPDPKKVLVIGLGSGSTAAAIASYPVESIDAVELEPAVVEGARYFSKLNRNVLDDPRLKMFINDGRNVLLVRPDQYDVIVSEPSNPWMAGVANLFSLEHYQVMSRRLKPGGIVCQWLHAYSMSPDDLRMIIRTFGEVFKDVELWTSYYPDLMLIGSMESRTIDFEKVKQKFEIPEVLADLSPHGIREPEGLFSSFWLGDDQVRRLSYRAKINRDNRPYLEFSAPRHLYEETLKPNFELINAFRTPSFPKLIHLEPEIFKNSHFFNEVGRGLIFKRMMNEAALAIGSSNQIQPENPGAQEVFGILAFRSDKFDEAVEALKKAIAGNPESAEAYYYLGLSLLKKEKWEEAVPVMEKAVQLDPENISYLKTLGDSLLGAKRPREALAIYQKVLKLKDADFYALARSSDILFETGTLAEQKEISEILMTDYPRFGLTYERMGKVYEARGLYEEALQLYLKLVSEFPNEARSYLNLANAYGKLGSKEKLKQVLQRAVELEPPLAKNPDVHRLLKEKV